MNKIQRFVKKMKFVFILFLFLVSIIYILFREPEDPCFNGIQDGYEEGVDCGGFCEKECPLTQNALYEKNIEINWVTFIPDGKNNYDLAASLSNKNELQGLYSFSYKFILYDESGEVIREYIGEDYLMPNSLVYDDSEVYIVKDNLYLSQTPDHIDIQLYDYNWEEISESDIYELNQGVISVSNKSYWFEESKETFMGRGETKNNSKYSFDRVDIGIILFDKNDQVISIAKTDQLTMVSGDGWGFEVVWPNLDMDIDDIGKIECVASTNVFDENNFMKDYKAE